MSASSRAEDMLLGISVERQWDETALTQQQLCSPAGGGKERAGRLLAHPTSSVFMATHEYFTRLEIFTVGVDLFFVANRCHAWLDVIISR